jgi:hypothetical protein
MIWAGWDDEKEEGSFANINTGEILRESNGFWPFYPGEPNGERMENCAVIWPSRDAWNDFLCAGSNFGFCQMQVRPRLRLRGVLKI